MGIDQNPESGAAVIDAVIGCYGSLSSYRDQGVVRTRLHPGDPPIEMRFATTYSSPDFFRFEFDRPHPHAPLRHIVTRYVVGSDGDRSFVFRQHQDREATVEFGSDLASTIGAVAGVSDGVSHVVSRLLLRQVVGFSLLDLREPRIIAESSLDGVPVRRLAAQHPSGEPWELLVERDSSLVRAIVRGSADVAHEHRAIRVDEAIPATEFAIPTAH